VNRTLRLAVIAALAVTAIASAVAVALELAAQPVAITPPISVSTATATVTPSSLWPGSAPALSEARTPRPSTTCRVLPTPNYPEPPHAPVNGQPSLGVPTLPGVILIKVAQCRDIQAILVKYGLAGPATLYLDVAPSDDMIANGLARWYQVVVVPGTESRTVVELYGHPEDIEYVQLIPVPGGRAVGG